MCTMRIPPFLLALVAVAAGIALPMVAPRLADPPAGYIGMDHDGYVVGSIEEHERDEEAGIVPTITIHAGDVLSFQNNSRWIWSSTSGTRRRPGTSPAST